MEPGEVAGNWIIWISLYRVVLYYSAARAHGGKYEFRSSVALPSSILGKSDSLPDSHSHAAYILRCPGTSTYPRVVIRIRSNVHFSFFYHVSKKQAGGI